MNDNECRPYRVTDGKTTSVLWAATNEKARITFVCARNKWKKQYEIKDFDAKLKIVTAERITPVEAWGEMNCTMAEVYCS